MLVIFIYKWQIENMKRNTSEIRKQELWTRELMIDFLQDQYGPDWRVYSASTGDCYDINASNIREGKFHIIEVKEFYKDPESFEKIIIKKNKVDNMMHRKYTKFDPLEIDVKVKPLYIVFYTASTKTYLFDLDKCDQYEIRSIRQPVVEFSENPEYKEFDMYMLPKKDAHVADIKPYLEKHGYNRNGI